MRIVFWGPYAGHVGTIQAQLQAAAALAAVPGYEVSLVRVHSEFAGHEQFCRENGIKLIDLGGARIAPWLSNSDFLHKRPYYIFSAFLGLLFLRRVFKEGASDIVVTNLISVIPLMLSRIYPRGPIVIASIQGYPQFLGPKATSIWKRLENKLRQALWAKVYSAASKIICMTEGTKAQLRHLYGWPSCKFAIVPNPIITERVRALAAMESAAFPAAAGTYRIVSVGRLSRQKGFDVLLGAFAKVNVSRPVALYILGSGEDELMLRSRASNLGIADRVHFLGFVENPFAIMKRSDLFVMASRWEDPGHTLVEAAALQVPIIATDCPHGPREVLLNGEAGILCAVDDEKCLAAAIQYVLQNGKDKKMVAKAEEVAANYTPNRYKLAMIKIIREVSGGDSATRH